MVRWRERETGLHRLLWRRPQHTVVMMLLVGMHVWTSVFVICFLIPMIKCLQSFFYKIDMPCQKHYDQEGIDSYVNLEVLPLKVSSSYIFDFSDLVRLKTVLFFQSIIVKYDTSHFALHLFPLYQICPLEGIVNY